jgi:ribulose kinase
VVGAAEARTARGAWGAYRGAPLPHLAMAEGGQSSTGSTLQWLVRLFGGDRDQISLPQLDAEAEVLAVGAEGVGMLETLQGSRTPVTDPRARGALLGLTLHHSRAHIWRAALEAICLGTKVCCARTPLPSQAGAP